MALTKVTGGGIGADAINGSKIADDSINSEHFVDGGLDLAHVSNDSVDESKLKISNSPTNGYVLTAQSGNTGGLTWAEMTGGGPSLGTDSIIRTNAQTISENITIGSSTNGMSAGPITIADGYTVTVNGNWSVV
jgi:hypothetical protein